MITICKVVYTDNGKDIAITGNIIQEDNDFLTIEREDRIVRINKKRIVLMEQGKADKRRTEGEINGNNKN